MRRFRNILFALAAFLWLPASAHCELESLPGLEFLRCPVEMFGAPASAKDCSQCCAVEKSQYRVESVWFNAPAPELTAKPFNHPQVVENALPDEVSLGVLVAAPPESFPTRHFLLRTALSPRAPSLLS